MSLSHKVSKNCKKQVLISNCGYLFRLVNKSEPIKCFVTSIQIVRIVIKPKPRQEVFGFHTSFSLHLEYFDRNIEIFCRNEQLLVVFKRDFSRFLTARAVCDFNLKNLQNAVFQLLVFGVAETDKGERGRIWL